MWQTPERPAENAASGGFVVKNSSCLAPPESSPPDRGPVFEHRPARQSPGNPAVTGCLNASAFVDTGAASWTNYTSFPAQARNQYYGPGFFDADMSLFKNFTIGERLKLGHNFGGELHSSPFFSGG
jgi:hypothetical protein